MDAMKQRCEELGIMHKCKFLGSLLPEEIPYSEADLVVNCPSGREGMSNVLMEALAHGVPVVATTVGGRPELLDNHSFGRLVPINNKRALIEAMRDFLMLTKTERVELKKLALKYVLENRVPYISDVFTAGSGRYCMSVCSPVLRGEELLGIVRTAYDTHFQLSGSDLWHLQTIELTDAVLGREIDGSTLEGAVKVTVPQGTQPNAVLRLSEKGLPHFAETKRGDLYLRLNVHIPEHLSDEERELYTKLRTLATDG